MENINNQLIQLIPVLQYLLPGFFSAWIFYGLTAYPKPSPFERVIQALIFTFIIRGATEILEACLNIKSSIFIFILSLLIALLLGILFSWFANNDLFHRFLRHLKITKETSYPSEWFGAFSNGITYVVLHLKDTRRIYGWPIEWPNDSRNGHFLLQNACWLEEENGKNKEVPLDDLEGMLIDSANVEMVEFVKNTEEKRND